MVTFKFETGWKADTFDMTKENFEKQTAHSGRFNTISGDGEKRYHAICPFCDNPIVIYGLYSRNKVSDKPYGSHYPDDVNGFAYNPLTKEHCPAYTGRKTTKKTDRYKDIQPLNREIYNSMRENFSSVVFILSQVLGMKIGYELAQTLLTDYVASDGHMYFDAGIYNTPWMLLYMAHTTVPLYKRMITEESPLYDFLSVHDKVNLVSLSDANGEPTKYFQIDKAGKYLDLRFDFALHDRKEVKGKLEETITLRVITRDWNRILTHGKDGKPVYGDKVVYEVVLPINEKRYPNLINSSKKITDARLDEIAKRTMPQLKE